MLAEELGAHLHVVVDDGDVLGRGLHDGVVTGHGLAGVGLLEELQRQGASLAGSLEDDLGIVDAPVDGHDELPAVTREGLPPEALEQTLQGPGPVVRGDHERDGRHRSTLAPVRSRASRLTRALPRLWHGERTSERENERISGSLPPRVPFGLVWVDRVTREQALDCIERLVAAGHGGAVFTPNVDHVVLAGEDAAFRAAYSRASLSLADGMPLVWSSRLLGAALPERVAGSDLVLPLLQRAAARGWRVFFLGGDPGVAAKARDRGLASVPELDIVGVAAPVVRVDASGEERAAALRPLVEARPDLVLVALGAPKQEIWIDQVRPALKPAVLVGVGASLDFLAGTVPRAPEWMARSGLEWLFRLGHEPRRLWRRYLIRDPKFLAIVAADDEGADRYPSPAASLASAYRRLRSSSRLMGSCAWSSGVRPPMAQKLRVSNMPRRWRIPAPTSSLAGSPSNLIRQRRSKRALSSGRLARSSVSFHVARSISSSFSRSATIACSSMGNTRPLCLK